MRAIDLFAGPGGWDYAAKQLGLVPWGYELDEATVETRKAAGVGHTVHADVAAQDPAKQGGCDLLIASPPCQAWSMAGKRGGERDKESVYNVLWHLANGRDEREYGAANCEDPRSILVVEPLRWALALKPTFLAWEQVPPVLELWRWHEPILRDLGYSVWTGILSAERYGVPQTRKRAILMASLDGTVAPPEPTHQAYEPGVPAQEQHGLFGTLEPWVSMAEALGWDDVDIPAPTVTGGGTDTGGPEPFGRGGRERIKAYDRRQGNTRPDGSREMVRPIPVSDPAPTIGAAGLSTGRDVWLKTRSDREERKEAGAGNQPRPVDAPAVTVDTGIRQAEWTGCADPLQLKGDDWPDRRPATVVAGDPRVFQPGGHHGEGEQSQNAVRVTETEAAILQGFPPDYPWQGSRSKRFQQIGNAVPPPLARAILTALIPELAERESYV